MIPKKIEQCNTELNLIAQVLKGIIEEMAEVDKPYISVSAQRSEKGHIFWYVSMQGNDKAIGRIESEGLAGMFEEITNV